MQKLATKLRTHGVRSLYAGALAASAATMVGHYPWFATYNFLDKTIPRPKDTMERLIRSALIGFCSTAVSDTASNSIRVLKTFRQTSGENLSYMTCARRVIASDGVMGLFGRGLKTKIISNGVQGALFSVLWKYFERMWASHQQA